MDTLQPLTGLEGAAVPPPPPEPPRKKLWLKLPGEQPGLMRRLELLLEMFPGREQMVLYFEDSGKRMGASCVIHSALLRELREMLGEGNVVVK